MVTHQPGLAKWSTAAVSNTAVIYDFGGSNPSPWTPSTNKIGTVILAKRTLFALIDSTDSTLYCPY